MKFNIELDITPEEVKELFEGNIDVFQRSLMEFFMRQMSNGAQVPTPDMMSFWQTMAEKSTSMFEQYQKAMTDAVTPKKN